MIERLERTKVVLHEESLSSIAADGIILLALLLTRSNRMHVRTTASVRARAPVDPRHTKLIQTINTRNPEDNKFIPVIG